MDVRIEFLLDELCLLVTVNALHHTSPPCRSNERTRNSRLSQSALLRFTCFGSMSVD